MTKASTEIKIILNLNRNIKNNNLIQMHKKSLNWKLIQNINKYYNTK